MKRATQTISGSILLALVAGGAMLVAACASDSSSEIPSGTGQSTAQTDPAANSGGSSGSSNSSSGGSGSNSGGSNSGTPAKTCVSKCMQDTDCANSCPVISGAISCCDQNTNVCYSTKDAMCPAPTQNDDAGTGGGAPAY